MADSNTVEATLRVNVTGEEQLGGLAKKLNAVGKAAHDIPDVKVGQAAGATVFNKLARTANLGMGRVVKNVDKGQDEAVRAVEAAAYKFGAALRTHIGASLVTLPATIGRAFTDPIKTTAGNIARAAPTLARGLWQGLERGVESGVRALPGALMGLGGALLRVTGLTAAWTAGIGALVGIGGALTGMFKLMTGAMEAAHDVAEETIELSAKARRYGRSPQDLEDRFAALDALMGKEGSRGQEQMLTRNLNLIRQGKGVRGDKEAFKRIGMTQKWVLDLEKKLGGRATMIDVAYAVAKQYEQEAAGIEAMRDGKKKAAAEAKHRQAGLTFEQIFGQKLADVITSGTGSERIRRNLEEQQKAAEEAAIKRAENSTTNIMAAYDPNKAMRQRGLEDQAEKNQQVVADRLLATTEANKRRFGELADSLGLLVMPAVERFQEALGRLTARVGPTITDQLARLAEAGFGKLSEYMDTIDPEKVKGVVTAIGDWAKGFVENLPNVQTLATQAATGINLLVGALQSLAGFFSGIQKFWDENVPGWVKDRISNNDPTGMGNAMRGLGALDPQNARRAIYGRTQSEAYEAKTAREDSLGGLATAADHASAALNTLGETPGMARRRAALEGPTGDPRLQPATQPGPTIQMPDFQPLIEPAVNPINQAFEAGGLTVSTSINQGAAAGGAVLSTSLTGAAETAKVIIQGVDLTATASAAGSAMGAAAVSAIRAGVAGINIPVKFGPVPSMVGMKPPTGGDSPSP